MAMSSFDAQTYLNFFKFSFYLLLFFSSPEQKVKIGWICSMQLSVGLVSTIVLQVG